MGHRRLFKKEDLDRVSRIANLSHGALQHVTLSQTTHQCHIVTSIQWVLHSPQWVPCDNVTAYLVAHRVHCAMMQVISCPMGQRCRARQAGGLVLHGRWGPMVPGSGSGGGGAPGGGRRDDEGGHPRTPRTCESKNPLAPFTTETLYPKNPLAQISTSLATPREPVIC
jgi:hypothetical protein